MESYLKFVSDKYQAWLHWSLTNSCNLNCEYCFGFNHHGGFIAQPVDISAVMSSLDRSGMVFRIGFTGNGEPFLIPNFTELCATVAQKHYLTINTNLTALCVSDLVKFDGLQAKILCIFASVHFFELSRLHLWERFVKNYQLLKSAGFVIELTAVAWPGLIGKIADGLTRLNCIEGKVNFEPFFGMWQGEKYPESYSSEQLDYFGLTQTDCEKFLQKNTLCNAGLNVGIITPTGKVKACFQENVVLGSIYAGFEFQTQMLTCRHKVCGCPLKIYDEGLFTRAKSGLTE